MAMTRESTDSPRGDGRRARASRGRSLRVETGALVLAAASGCAALIYEVVWFEQLALAIGSSALSLGALLATFLGGMALGALALARWRGPLPSPLKLFAFLELGIALLAATSAVAIPQLGSIYTEWAGAGLAGVVWRLLVSALCLLPPCLLMGATLPALARAVALTRRGVTWLGVCYGANTLGAVLGSLGAAFVLLRHYDVTAALRAAVAINVASGAVALALDRGARQASAKVLSDRPTRAHFDGAAVYVVAGLSGFTALTAEVVWTRQLALLLGGTVYTFALVLAVFLFGLALGGGSALRITARVEPRTALALGQWLIAPAVVWGAYVMGVVLPYWPLDVTQPMAPGARLGLDLGRAALVVLPAACLWGAALPLAVAAFATPQHDARRVVGHVYAANTTGAILGALAASFVLIVTLGSRGALAIAVLVAAVAGGLALVGAVDAWPALRRRGALAAVALAAASLAAILPSVPPALVAFGRFMPTRGADADVIYVGEGLTAAIAVSREPSGVLMYHDAGKTQASTYPQDLRLQRMLGHLATLLVERPSSVLVIGLGAGITAGAVSLDPAVERVVVAEIEPLARDVARQYFAAANFGVLDRDRVEIRNDDGRHYLATAHTTFDAITSDPLDPWVKGAAALYTREFWRLCKSKLNDDGVVTVFLQLYEIDEAAVRSELATFFEAFPGGAVFANTVDGQGYDAVLVGRKDDAPIDLTAIERRLDRTVYAPVATSLREVGFDSALDLLGTYAGRGADFAPWLAGAEINTDRDLRLQYLAGAALNTQRAPALFAALLGDGPNFPEGYFVGAPADVEALRQRLAARRGQY